MDKEVQVARSEDPPCCDGWAGPGGQAGNLTLMVPCSKERGCEHTSGGDGRDVGTTLHKGRKLRKIFGVRHTKLNYGNLCGMGLQRMFISYVIYFRAEFFF